MTEPFTRQGTAVAVHLDPMSRHLLATLPGLLADAGDAGGRLSYRVHPDDPDAEERYRDLVGDSLDDLRDADRETLAGRVGEATISLEDAEAWMRVIGEARLVLAATLGITEDGWEGAADPGENPQLAVLTYLGYLQDGLVSVLS